MFQASKAKTVAGYLAAVPPERQAAIRFLHRFIRQTVPKLKPHFAYNMLGYGSFPYVNYKKQKVAWPVVALANQKQYLSLYICALDQGRYVAEVYRKQLGKVSVGKSCIRLKKVEDLDLPTLKIVLKQAAKSPGLRSTK